MPPGKLNIAFRLSVISNTVSFTRGTSMVICVLPGSKKSVKGPTAA